MERINPENHHSINNQRTCNQCTFYKPCVSQNIHLKQIHRRLGIEYISTNRHVNRKNHDKIKQGEWNIFYLKQRTDML